MPKILFDIISKVYLTDNLGGVTYIQTKTGGIPSLLRSTNQSTPVAPINGQSILPIMVEIDAEMPIPIAHKGPQSIPIENRGDVVMMEASWVFCAWGVIGDIRLSRAATGTIKSTKTMKTIRKTKIVLING